MTWLCQLSKHNSYFFCQSNKNIKNLHLYLFFFVLFVDQEQRYQIGTKSFESGFQDKYGKPATSINDKLYKEMLKGFGSGYKNGQVNL